MIIAKAGIYDLRLHHDEVIMPILRHWKVFERSDFGPVGEKARDELAQFLSALDKQAATFVDRRAIGRSATSPAARTTPPTSPPETGHDDVRHVFAGVRVSDLAVSADWFERLLGRGASFAPNDTELVWDHSDGGSVFIELSTEGAGFSRVTLFVDDLDDFLGGAAGRGIEPVRRETYDNGVRHATFHDPDGNAISCADMPAAP